jgi:hypothetical protein
MNVRLRHDISFTAGVYYDGNMRMNSYSLTLWMTTACTDATDQNTAFERIKHFVYSEMDSTIFINSFHNTQCKLLAAAGLNITTMPGEPVDQLIGLMLYHKLNAITEGRMIIQETELASVMGEGIAYLHSDYEQTMLPAQPDWWQTADPMHCDPELLDTDKVLNLPQATLWRDLDLAWCEPNTIPDTGSTVLFADFKPKQ